MFVPLNEGLSCCLLAVVYVEIIIKGVMYKMGFLNLVPSLVPVSAYNKL